MSHADPARRARLRVFEDHARRRLEDGRGIVVGSLAQGRQAQLDDAQADQLALAVDEASTNVIEHAYRGAPGRTMV